MTHIQDYYKGTPEKPTQLILKLRHIDEEYVVEWWEDGIYKEGPTYYTDYLVDAVLTMEAMACSAKKKGMIVRCVGPTRMEVS